MGMRLLLKLFLVLVAQIKLYAETKPTQISIDPLVAFYLTASDTDRTKHSLRAATKNHPMASKPLFLALRSTAWPPGLVPIYQVDDPSSGEAYLARRLTHAKENVVEPLCFALPIPSEVEACRVNGRWELEATHQDGALEFLYMDWAQLSGNLFGRMDPDTDYRFAWLTGGSYGGKKLQIQINYIDTDYLLTGTLAAGSFQGKWSRADGLDGGDWTGRPVGAATSAWPLGPLAYLVTVEDHRKSPRWELRVTPKEPDHALCRVWLPPSPSKRSAEGSTP